MEIFFFQQNDKQKKKQTMQQFSKNLHTLDLEKKIKMTEPLAYLDENLLLSTE